MVDGAHYLPRGRQQIPNIRALRARGGLEGGAQGVPRGSISGPWVRQATQREWLEARLPPSPPQGHQDSILFLWVTLGKDIPPLCLSLPLCGGEGPLRLVLMWVKTGSHPGHLGGSVG